MKKFMILICVVVFAVGCSQKDGSKGPVLAKVEGTVITKEDFLNKINRVPEWARDRFQSEEGKKEFLDELIKEQLIYKDAMKNGLDRDENFKRDLEEFKKMNLIKIILEKEVEKKAKLDPKEVKDFFDKNKEKFTIGTEVKAKHILVDTEQQAKDVLKKLTQNENFSRLAEQYSRDKATAKIGGDLGFFGRGRMVPEFEAVAFNLKVGEVSGPVKTRFGYHIVQVTDRKEGRPGSFDEIKGTLERQLMIEKQKALFDTYVEKLKKDAKIETAVYETELKALTVEKAPADESKTN